MNRELVSYIQTARAWGISNEEILENLKKVGWESTDIFEAFRSLDEKAAIEATNIYKSFGRVRALSGVTIRVPYGKVFALLGPNGAGKTTLVRVLATLLRPDWGKVKVAGLSLPHYAQQVRALIGVTGQYVAVDETLTARENLRLIGRLYHLDKRIIEKRTRELLWQFGLTEAANRVVGTYSAGMRRRLDLALSLINNPQILFLDEPTIGLDPQSRNVLWKIIENLARSGVTILLTTQYMEEADHLSDYIFILDRGELIAEGTPQELKSQFGRSVLEVHLAEGARINEAATLLSSLGEMQVHKDEELGIITLPVRQDFPVLLEAVRALDRENIPLVDVLLRRPTLNDVFLELTGREVQLQ